MPKISEFFGISVYVYYSEHKPPHFHARYGDDAVEVAINTLAVLCGRLPPRALGLVMEWASARQAELRATWNLAEAHLPLGWIEPLG